MKKLIILSAIAAGAMFSTQANAQIGVSLGLHFGNGYGPIGHVVIASQPVYTEPAVYDDDYYYLPDVGAYYSVNERVYYYNNGGRWMSAAYLPGYRDYDWRTANRYEIRASRPYLNNSYYSERFDRDRSGWNNEPRRFDRPDRRRDDHFDNHNDRGRGQEQHFDNRGDNNFNRPQGGFDRGNNNPRTQQDNRPQGGGFSQPQQNAQPSRGGNGRGNNGGGGQHFTDNQFQGSAHRIARS
ncbi:MAG: hypothetical protein ABI367_15665 [Mucilaginibacter sp.]